VRYLAVIVAGALAYEVAGGGCAGRTAGFLVRELVRAAT
jgi:hypothetical protein